MRSISANVDAKLNSYVCQRYCAAPKSHPRRIVDARVDLVLECVALRQQLPVLFRSDRRLSTVPKTSVSRTQSGRATSRAEGPVHSQASANIAALEQSRSAASGNHVLANESKSSTARRPRWWVRPLLSETAVIGRSCLATHGSHGTTAPRTCCHGESKTR